MKNTHILPNTEVPIELRKEVYREALKIIESGEKPYDLFYYELCFLLPCILWDLKDWKKVRINGDLSYTKTLFPELGEELQTKKYFLSDQSRINFLKSVI